MRSRPSTIRPARPTFKDGAVYSAEYADIYHSVDGAIEEARHVFIAGNGLPDRWHEAGNFTIVETGFGCGLNFLATWDAFKRSGTACRLDFVSVEKHPFGHDDLGAILRAWPQLETFSRQLLHVYPPLVPGFHRLHFDDGRVTLTLLLGDAIDTLTELDARADAFFLDGFAPAKNPDMWSEILFEQIGRIAAPGATAATYSSAAVVRHGLERVGFVTQKQAGFGRKREMLTGRLPGHSPCQQAPGKAVVIGAGIAGASCAFALARRGIEVELLDRESSPGSGSSANPAAVVRPFPTLDTGARSAFTWSAFLYAVRLYRELSQRADFNWHETGVLQLARDAAHHDRLVRALALLGYPPEVVCFVSAREASQLCGAPVSEAGVWFPAGGFADGHSLCTALVESMPQSVTFRGRVDARTIRAEGEMVRITDADDRVLASAHVVILANGVGAQGFISDGAPWLRGVRGQVTGVTPLVPGLCAPVCREGYVTPEIGQVHYVGATFDESRAAPSIADHDHAVNVQRAERILRNVFGVDRLEAKSGWAGVRCVSPDRLPVVGALGASLYGCVAMGSRGFSWAPLAAEAVASFASGAPAPLARSVLHELAAMRFSAATDQRAC